MGYDAVPADYDVIGDLAYQPVHAKVEDLQARALRERPDYRAAELGITAAQSQIGLAKANSKVGRERYLRCLHIAGETTGSFFASFDLPIFNRNQGEIARTNYALTQAKEQGYQPATRFCPMSPTPMRRSAAMRKWCTSTLPGI